MEDIIKLTNSLKLTNNIKQHKLELDNVLDNSFTKKEKFHNFLKFYEYLPKQGSKEWLEYKKGNQHLPPTIGGSEMFQLVSSYRALAETKLLGSSFTGNIYTYWGNIFEEVIAIIFDMLFQCPSYETGSIPGLKNSEGHIVQTYSPDRLMLVNKDRMEKILMSDFNQAIKDFESELKEKIKNETELIILDEFKCPSIDIPDGTIPKKYQYQPPTGMCTIPIIDLALFCNASFRRCNVNQYNFSNEYNNNKHHKDPIFDEASFIGIIGFYEIPKDYNYDVIRQELIKIQDYSGLRIYKHVYELLKKNKFLTSVDNIDYTINTFSKELNINVRPHLLNYDYPNFYKYIYSANYSNKNDNYINHKISTESTTCSTNFETITEHNTKYETIVKYNANCETNIKCDTKCETIIECDTNSENNDKSSINYEISNKSSISNKDNIKNDNEYVQIIYNDHVQKKFIEDIKDLFDMEDNVPDLGDSNQIEDILKEAVSSRFDPTSGYQTYYGEPLHNFKFNDLVDTEFIDTEIHLQKSIQSFIELRKKGYKLIGYMPWKLFKCCIIPMFKDPKFLDPFKEKIIYLVDSVHKIKQEGSKIENKTEFYQQELDKYFGPKKKSNTKSVPKFQKAFNDSDF